MPKRLPIERSAISEPGAHGEIRRAVSDLYERVRSRGAVGGGDRDSWTLLTEFTVERTRFVVACRTENEVSSRLSPREREIVALARAGESNKGIGYRLGISPSTVGVHLWRAASKLGVANRADLIRALQPNP